MISWMAGREGGEAVELAAATSQAGGDAVTSLLQFGRLARLHHDWRVTCSASNTNLSAPATATATIKLKCKDLSRKAELSRVRSSLSH